MSTHKIIPIHYEKLIRLFEIEGFSVKRKKGDDILMTKTGINRPLVISIYWGPFIGVKSLILTNRYRREKRKLPELGSSN